MTPREYITEQSQQIINQLPNRDEDSDSESDEDLFDDFLNDLFDVPMIRCVNCRHLITPTDDIIDPIYAVRFPNIVIAFAVPLMNSLIIRSTEIERLSDIFWQNVLHCKGCDITLTIRYLTIYNTMIDEYVPSDDIPCVILDASSVVVE